MPVLFIDRLTPYALIVSLGAALGLALSVFRRREGAVFLADGGLALLFTSLIVARLEYAVLHWEYFNQHPGEIPRVWLGGLSWGGALLGGMAALILLSLWSRWSPGSLLDAYLPLLGSLAVSLWFASWVSGAGYGPPADAWWGIPVRDAFGQAATRWPLPLLGALLTGGGLFLIGQLRLKGWTTYPGQRGVLGLLLVAVINFSLSFLRVDPGPFFHGLRWETWLAGFFGAAFLLGYGYLVRYYKMNKLTIDPARVTDALTRFIRDTIQDAGFSRAVVGVSGGVDSALSTFLTARALGSEHVLALRLPYESSSPDSLTDADQVIEETGVQSTTYPITAGVDAVLEQLPDADQVRRGNVMARMRMIFLYDQAAASEGLVVGTGNKTEILLGYSTLHGDAAFDLNPLADLYKDQVRQLAEFLGVPRAIIDKPPSADLWEGQTDEEELGFTYQQADHLLYLLVEEGRTIAECVEEGFEQELVEEVVARVEQYRFKSKLPPAASIGQRPIEGLEELPAFSG